MPRSRIKHETTPEVQKAFLVGVEFKDPAYRARAGARLPLESSMEELALLCKTAGLEVVGQTTQTLDAPNPNTFIGPGKLEELIAWRSALDFDVVVFDDELSPRHLRELEEALGEDVIVLDRTGLILDIFAQHARTREGALQVELAQYEYRKPRLTRQWTHLARQAGGGAGRSGTGGVGLRGPGETQLEIDRRRIDERIARLKRELEEVRKQRAQHRAQRKRAEIPVVAIVGYTNAGKSTLLNAIAKADVLAEDKLFATLDPTTRRVRLPHGHLALFTDTVGFIQKLPTQLVAAFRATLEEITEADALLHVVDITHPSAFEQAQTVIDTLRELGAGAKPVVTVLNKAEQLSPEQRRRLATGALGEGIFISALRREGLDTLLAEVEAVLFERLVPIRVRLPYKASDLMALFRREGAVDSELPEERSVVLSGRIPGRLLEVFMPYAAGRSAP
ncbi:MAG: GTPase HflX [Candidatus Thermofonsia Clade 3 bacterium]|uniref:GTPase HflX n=1 Tax=Candidatus Thermofonsia Clade 3 bacterium TaxID=2364212 RepID=A0A2M8QBD5_9CHLR|nr:GTPase HflX [Candidatus Roseilinea sp. NK_OTU-006]PJF47080.1 MAG: GTPase HflX [Candidatus Thermofonsia Clade 3 bacterium]